MKKNTIGLMSIIEAINNMSSTDIEKEVMSIPEDKEKEVLQMAIEFCYDRSYCDALKVPYADIKDADIWKMKAFSYNLIKLGGPYAKPETYRRSQK
jgi:hypothetical protein